MFPKLLSVISLAVNINVTAGTVVDSSKNCPSVDNGVPTSNESILMLGSCCAPSINGSPRYYWVYRRCIYKMSAYKSLDYNKKPHSLQWASHEHGDMRNFAKANRENLTTSHKICRWSIRHWLTASYEKKLITVISQAQHHGCARNNPYPSVVYGSRRVGL